MNKLFRVVGIDNWYLCIKCVLSYNINLCLPGLIWSEESVRERKAHTRDFSLTFLSHARASNMCSIKRCSMDGGEKLRRPNLFFFSLNLFRLVAFFRCCKRYFLSNYIWQRWYESHRLAWVTKKYFRRREGNKHPGMYVDLIKLLCIEFNWTIKENLFYFFPLSISAE
jgi:hypothetical protein